MFDDTHPLIKGYAALSHTLKSQFIEFLRDKTTTLVKTLDACLAFENESFTNREGSSKAKRRLVFNRFVLKLESNLKDYICDRGDAGTVDLSIEYTGPMSMDRFWKLYGSKSK